MVCLFLKENSFSQPKKVKVDKFQKAGKSSVIKKYIFKRFKS